MESVAISVGLTSLEKREETQPILPLNIDIEPEFPFRRWSISLMWPILLILMLVWIDRVILLGLVIHWIRLIQMTEIRVPVCYENGY